MLELSWFLKFKIWIFWYLKITYWLDIDLRNANNLLVSWCVKPKYTQVGYSSNFFINFFFIHLGFPFALNLNPPLTLNNRLLIENVLSILMCTLPFQPFHFRQMAFLFISFAFSMAGIFNAWMQMRHFNCW
jgi:hypothetical protein